MRTGLCTIVLTALAFGASAAEKPSDAELVAWVDQRVQERQPGEGDRRFDDIGWAKDIRTAIDLANKHRRLVFLFTHDGRMNVGRC